MQCIQCYFSIAIFILIKRIIIFGYIIDVQIQDFNKGHTILGNDIILECLIKSHEKEILVEWKSPLNFNLTNDRINISTRIEKSDFFYLIKSNFKLKKSKLEDESIYYCYITNSKIIFDSNYKYLWVSINEINSHVIKLHSPQTFFDVSNTQFNAYIRAHPEPKFYWFDKFNKTTLSQTNNKFIITTNYSNSFANYKSILKINDFQNEDNGNYSLLVKNKQESKLFNFVINITGIPIINLKIKKKYEINCKSVSYPKSNITWFFKKCTTLSCFLNESNQNEELIANYFEDNLEENGFEINSYISLNDSDIGLIGCKSRNSLGEQLQMQYVYKTNSGFEIFEQNMIQNKKFIIVEALFHETVTILCSVSSDYLPEIQWYRSGRNYTLDDVRVPIRGFDEYRIIFINAVFSSVSILKIINVGQDDIGEYFCRTFTKNGTVVVKSFELIAKEQPLLNVATNMQHNKTILAKYGTIWKFYCNVNGYPTPSITWYKNNLTITNSKTIQIKDKNQTLELHDIEPNHNGTYICEVSNRLGEKITKSAILGAIENDFNWLLVVIICLAIILTIISIFIVTKIRKDNKLKNELKAVGLANFEEGAIESINPNLTLGDQADLLPYDKKFEIPNENLKLGKELGSGAFGVVYKGDLFGFSDKESTPVAVKTVNKFAGHDCIKALASELKIMVHLGKHINIVNLIGACTKDITKKKLMVVVEFCLFGNLQDYILSNRKSFIDQRVNDNFDWRINPKKFEIKSEDLTYVSQKSKLICSQDFLVWALQVSKGMEYLAINKVLHGDLAARNVLLAEDNIVKISDFGLSRSMYKNGIYKKSAKCPLPIKWMAVESIGQNIFSTQSDIWSFGILIWEFFSLAQNPYPGIPIDQNFYKKLLDGYRMEIPKFATTLIYDIMLNCWHSDPLQRPSFTQLGETIGKMLAENIKNRYVDMSNYVKMQNSNSSENYLSKMASATYETQVSDYVSNLNYFHAYQNNVIFDCEKTD